MTIAREFAEFGASLRWEALPEEVRQQARLCLLDGLGATLAAAASPTAELGAALARRYGSTPVAGLIGRPERTNSPFAALANGMAVHALEMDDGHRYAVGLHNGCTTVPAALAVAEEENAPLENLLAAMVLGYEVAGRIGTVVNPAHRHMGFHSTGTIGVFGATAAACYLRNLHDERFARALGIAGSASAGVFELLSDGSTSKHFHGGHAAMSGVLAADLAAGGMTGPMSILEGREGFFRVFGRDVDPKATTRGLGERYDILRVFFKLHATCAHIFPVIDAVLDLRGQVEPASEVERMVVDTYRAAAILNEPHPRTRSAAKFSIPYCAAVAWLHGRATDDMFSDRFLHDEALQQLAGRVDTREDAALESNFPRARAVRVEVALRGGRRLEAYVDLPRGMPERPATREELVVKFRSLACPVLGQADARTLEDAVLDGKGLPVRSLVALTQPTED